MEFKLFKRISTLCTLIGLISLFSIAIGADSTTVKSKQTIDSSDHTEIYRLNSVVNANESKNDIPKNFILYQNYPNPFNPTTKISFGLFEASNWILNIYNINGQLVESFFGSTSGSETITVDWNASKYATGPYFYRITVNGISETKKMYKLK